ncbi:MAG: dihydroorotase [Candidatus Aureabacteria bacterium]|nr:dihydroorotase [Candidatus Auribacterota bacterium]
MKTLIKNGKVIDTESCSIREADILVEEARIASIRKNIKEEGCEVFDAKGLIVCPGFIDLHVHLREPGFEAQETIETGTKAALKGGFTTVVCMPNTNPPVDNEGIVSLIKLRAEKDGYVEVLPTACITKGRLGEELAEISKLVAAGACAISDDGSTVMNSLVMRRALEYIKMFNIPLIDHCEDHHLSDSGLVNEGYCSTSLGLKGIPSASEEIIVLRDILLCEYVNSRVHIAHVSTKGSVSLIREAKKRGVRVTAETAPHYFSLTDKSLVGYDTNFKVNPPLRSSEDMIAIQEGLRDGTLDAIATDHAPHTSDDKDKEFQDAPFGMIGLETSFAVGITELYRKDVLSLPELVQKYTVGPACVLGLDKGILKEGHEANITIVDTEKSFMVREDFFAGKSRNSPYLGRTLQGTVEAVFVNGNLRYNKGSFRK